MCVELKKIWMKLNIILALHMQKGCFSVQAEALRWADPHLGSRTKYVDVFIISEVLLNWNRPEGMVVKSLEV